MQITLSLLSTEKIVSQMVRTQNSICTSKHKCVLMCAVEVGLSVDNKKNINEACGSNKCLVKSWQRLEFDVKCLKQDQSTSVPAQREFH